jgi:hypothetical protein
MGRGDSRMELWLMGGGRGEGFLEGAMQYGVLPSGNALK